MYIFEDDGRDVLSKLFKRSYNSNMVSKFIYAKSVGNIKSLVIDSLSYSDYVIVYMDLVPDNLELRKVYNTLRLLSIANDYRVVILPVPCIEYLFIKSISNYFYNDFIDTCINYLPYRDLLDDSVERVTTFERFCKYVLKYKVPACMSTNMLNITPVNFYEDDCKLGSVVCKSNNFLSVFPAVPANVEIDGMLPLNDEDVWKVHTECVNLYNEAVVRFNKSGSGFCKKILPIK